MTQQRPRAYTDEVKAAMQAQGLMPTAPEPAPIPVGQVRYQVHISDVATTSGQASPAAVAATLRAFADQLDPPGKVYRNA